jgi:hypothetical protein
MAATAGLTPLTTTGQPAGSGAYGGDPGGGGGGGGDARKGSGDRAPLATLTGAAGAFEALFEPIDFGGGGGADFKRLTDLSREAQRAGVLSYAHATRKPTEKLEAAADDEGAVGALEEAGAFLGDLEEGLEAAWERDWEAAAFAVSEAVAGGALEWLGCAQTLSKIVF